MAQPQPLGAHRQPAAHPRHSLLFTGADLSLSPSVAAAPSFRLAVVVVQSHKCLLFTVVFLLSNTNSKKMKILRRGVARTSLEENLAIPGLRLGVNLRDFADHVVFVFAFLLTSVRVHLQTHRCGSVSLASCTAQVQG